MPVRNFDGVDDRITCAVGSTGFTFTGTLAVLFNKTTAGAEASQYPLHCSSSGSNGYGLRLNNLGDVFARLGATNIAAPSIKALPADGWVLIAFTKASTAAVDIRFHKYVFSSKIWTRESAAGVTSSVGGAEVRLGMYAGGAGYFAGNISFAGVWNRVLTDTEINTLVTSKQAWADSTPIALWPLDQATRDDPVQDTVGTADQLSITGTTVVGEEVPWTSGDLIVVTPGGGSRGGKGGGGGTVGGGGSKPPSAVDKNEPQFIRQGMLPWRRYWPRG